mgnify:CR=1 FL=1
MKVRRFLLIALCIVTLLAASGCKPATEQPSTDNGTTNGGIPKMMTWGSYEVGSATYNSSAVFAETLMEKHGIKVRIIPASAATERVYPLRTKKTEIVFCGIDSLFMQEGLYQFADYDWGPQPVRELWFSQSAALALAVSGNSDIQKVSDLRGKKVPYHPGADSTNMYIEAILAFGGLTYDDCIKVEAPGYTAAHEMAMSGALDTCLIGSEAPSALEWETMPGGLRWLETPADDAEGWDRVRKIHPEYVPVLISEGAGIEDGETVELGTASSPRLITMDWLDDDYAYFITKTLHECHEELAQKDRAIRLYWGTEKNLKMFQSSGTPYHGGSVRYFKEIGVWTDELEAMNQERIKRQNSLIKLYEEIRDECLDKGVSAKNFPEIWLKAKEDSGLGRF